MRETVTFAIILTILFLSFIFCSKDPANPMSDDTSADSLDWLGDYAVHFRSIDPEDEDLSMQFGNVIQCLSHGLYLLFPQELGFRIRISAPKALHLVSAADLVLPPASPIDAEVFHNLIEPRVERPFFIEP